MGASDIIRANLRSKVTRETITKSADGIRRIGPTSSDSGGFLGSLANFLGGLFGAIISFSGWLIGRVLGLAFSFVGVWGLLVKASTFIWNFNWNATDAELDTYLKNLETQIAGQLGGTLGSLVGFLVCGVAPGAAMFTFNEVLALKLLKDVGEEALQELGGNLATLCEQTFTYLTQRWLINKYKSIRRSIKNFLKDPSSPQSRLFSRLFGNLRNAIEAWGEEGQQPWSFSQALEDAIDSIPDPRLREFTEEFIEEALESCVEAGYIIANGLDTWVLQQKQSKDIILGSERILEVTPNREAPDEKLLLVGREELVKESLVTTLGSTYTLIEHRDLGMFVGEPLRDNITRQKGTGINSISIRIIFYSVRKPPFRPSDKKTRRTYITIPGVERNKIDWEGIKAACGGANGYMWGGNKGFANLVNEDNIWVSVMKIYTAMEQEAIQRLEAFAALSQWKISNINITQQTKKGTRGQVLYKEPMRVYPAYFTIVNTQKINNEEEGRAEISGTYKRRKDKIFLWTDKKPDDFEDVVRDLLTSPGANNS